MEKLGIIGGMGPAATARLFSRIIDFTDVESDQEHIDITIINRPSIPDRTAFLLGNSDESFVPHLKEIALKLEDMGCGVLALPCNTSHALIDEIEDVLTESRIVNMPLSSMLFASSLGCENVGVLATDGTIRTEVFQRSADASGIGSSIPSYGAQEMVMDIIYKWVKAGTIPDAVLLESIFEDLEAKDCDAFVLGCTELSLIDVPALWKDIPIIDALDVLAWKCVQECGYDSKDLREKYLA